MTRRGPPFGSWLLAPVLGAALALPGLARAAPSPGWSIEPSPNSSQTRTHNVLTATACVSDGDCWAVGYYNLTAGTLQTLVQHWDGASWTVAPSPNTGSTQSNVLRGVACAAANDCWAVGSYSEPGSPQRTLALHWDGVAWTRVASPNSGDGDYNYLNGVACASASACWAVGYRSVGSGFQTLTLRWDGSAWSIVASANGAAASQSFLDAVACASATDCWAVGWFVSAVTGFNQTLVQRWNGSAWAAIASPNALASTHNDLHGIACAAASDCWAVGSASNGSARQTLALRWNGTAWAQVTSPSTAPTVDNALVAVACRAATDCWAVGNGGAVPQTLALRWDGGAWAIAGTPNAGTAQDNSLRGVACAGATGCWAVGSHDDGLLQALALAWGGSVWTAGAAANVPASQNNTLIGVTCASASDCWAVASYFNGSVQQTLIERWDGTAWRVVPSPNTSAGESNILYDVSCTPAGVCWAVGYALGLTAWQPLALRWDGAAWTIVPMPGTSTVLDHFITGVTCPSPTSCLAVGFYNDGSVYRTLALRWDGAQWAVVPSANTAADQENRLARLSCVSATDCWAVGLYKVDGFRERTLIEHWDGGAWSIVASPNTAALENNYLEDVACVATDDCWAVGAARTGGPGTGQPLIQRWDGTAWSIAYAPQPTAEPQYNYNFVKGITCPTATECWAVGDTFSAGSAHTLVLHLAGGAWSVVESPNSSATQNNRLVAVGCASALACWAVGYYTDDAGILHTLTQRYVAPAAAPDPFAFVERTGVATGVFVTSEAVTLRGFDGPLAIGIDAGQYSLDGGAYTTRAGTAVAGQSLRLRHISSDDPLVTVTSTVTVGAQSATLRSTTSSVDRTPASFGFAMQTGVARSAEVVSNEIAAGGFNTAVAIAAGPGCAYRINGGPWSTASGTLAPGDRVQTRHTSADAGLTYTKTYLKIGGVAGYFTTRTQ